MTIIQAQLLLRREATRFGFGEFRTTWTYSKQTCGRCRSSKYGGIPCLEIELSEPHVILNTDEVVLDTIRHELAHALTPDESGSHGPLWKAKCLEVGCKPEQYAANVRTLNSWARHYALCADCNDLHESAHQVPRLTVCDCGTPLKWKRVPKADGGLQLTQQAVKINLSS